MNILLMGFERRPHGYSLVSFQFPPLPVEISSNVNITTLPNRTAIGFGGAAQLNSLILEAFQCLTTIRETPNEREESARLIEVSE